jgi:hypothetical protein
MRQGVLSRPSYLLSGLVTQNEITSLLDLLYGGSMVNGR